MTDPHFLSARQAAGALGVTRATLYAYTSRGRLRSEPVPGRSRERRYLREDVERLQERKEGRRDPAAIAARGLHWGGPVLESAITLIDRGRLFYRGQDAVTLAESADLETVAMLLWEATGTSREQLFEQPGALTLRQWSRLRACVHDTFALLQAALPVAAASDPASYDLRPDAVRQTGARIVRLFTTAIAPRHARLPVHRALQAAWAPRHARAGEVIRITLALCADHELNVSAFAARCAASAGASPYDVVSAAMATLKGYKHGGSAERALALLADADTPRHARSLVANRLRRGEGLPGFGHPLYPAGDPRAAVLMRLAESSGNDATWRPVRNLCRA